MESLCSTLKKADADWIRQLRRHIHQYPELSGKEEQTAGLVKDTLHRIGVKDIQSGIAGHGIVARLGENMDGPVVALRADMDALPIQEETGISFASRHDGVMHACGHDAHTAMLLGAAKILKEMEDRIQGCILFIFQPAEENSPIGGAQPMMEAGALDDPQPDAVFGLHVWPQLPVGQIGIKPGFQMGASDRFEIRVQGQGGHASMPHETIDATMTAVQISQVLQTIVSRNVNPLETAVLSISSIQAGTTHNVIPDQASLMGTVRTVQPEIRELMEKRIRQVAKHVAHSMGAQVHVDYHRGYPVLNNDLAMVEVVRKTVREQWSEQALPEIRPALTAEDFAAYLEKFPGAFFWLGCGFTDPEHNFPLHHPRFLVDERILPLGAELLSTLALRYLAEKRGEVQ
ncbi:amidohydrolase [Kroppenstedtia pulmonis]|uniref:Amidohydrolase n=1 Tax=Kroppenstedtia pulmonis TaxID=1380685 RepID=A0A7D3XKY4_9BACL|nr:amidohydrolase [Kroppenstedtia pulmonis]QKG83329.1 amidohydrolase [Kroppenstedtia pulmonis]